MAAPRDPGGLAIGESTANAPPGWQPGLDWYPFRLYVEKIKIWYQTTEWADDKLGPVIAQRLKDGALRVALTLKLPLPIADGGGIVVGGAALARPAVAQQVDGHGNVLQPAIRSGAAELMHKLEQRYGLDQQDRVVSSLDGFFDFRRGRLSLQD